MKFNYYPETDSLYIDLSDKTSIESQGVAPGIVLDYGADERLIGIDIDNASHIVDLKHFEINLIPVFKQNEIKTKYAGGK